MLPKITTLVKAIHSTPHKVVFYVTGGAAQLSSFLLCVPGASDTVLEIVTPYSTQSSEQLLANCPLPHASFVSRETAEALSYAAYTRAVQLADPGALVLGFATTCSLVSKTPKRGPHRAWVASCDGKQICSSVLNLDKHFGRDRWNEDMLTSCFALTELAAACGVSSALYMNLMSTEPSPQQRDNPVQSAEEKHLIEISMALLGSGDSTESFIRALPSPLPQGSSVEESRTENSSHL